jgi:hypothetical protein
MSGELAGSFLDRLAWYIVSSELMVKLIWFWNHVVKELYCLLSILRMRDCIECFAWITSYFRNNGQVVPFLILHHRDTCFTKYCCFWFCIMGTCVYKYSCFISDLIWSNKKWRLTILYIGNTYKSTSSETHIRLTKWRETDHGFLMIAKL